MMKRTMRRDRREAPGEDVEKRWAKLIQDDVNGIDGDIERLIGAYQAKLGYSHDRATAELVRKLSAIVGPETAAWCS